MRRTKRVLTLLILLPLLIGLAATSLAEGGADDPDAVASEGAASVADKDEVVYARLFGDGQVEDVYVVNHFTLYEGGGFSDYGDYASVVNLTDLGELALSDDAVTIRTASENFYYQGNLKQPDLPWLYRVEYMLDGTDIRPEVLAGQSGRLEIRLSAVKNEQWSDDTFYDHYMQQITLTLPTEKCHHITADGATSANVGKDRALVFTILPGNDARFTVTADVRDFEMAGVDITAMPFSMDVELPDMSDMLDDFTKLSDAIAEMNNGAEQLKDGAAEMKSGADKLKNGSSEFSGGLSQLGANAAGLTDASAQIRGALSRIASSLNDADSAAGPDLTELAKLPGALAQLADGLTQIVGGVIQLKDGCSLAITALDQAIAGIPDVQISEERLYGLYAKADEVEQALLGELMENYAAAMTVKGTYEQVKTAFVSIPATLDTLSESVQPISDTLKTLSAQISDALSGMDSVDIMARLRPLVGGLAELSQNYANFHNGLLSYTQGVSALSDGFAGLGDGVSGLGDGASALYDGLAEFGNGANRLATETSDLPERVQTEIDKLTDETMGGSFDIVSFTSDRNKNVSFVQFVFKTEGVEAPAVAKDAPSNQEPQNFWERLKSLFI